MIYTHALSPDKQCRFVLVISDFDEVLDCIKEGFMYLAKALFGISAVATFALVFSAPSIAADKVSKFQGYLVDKQCADSVREDSDPEAFIKHHTQDCALMINCRRKGYSLYAKPNWFDFNKQGNKLAIKVLQKSKRNDSFYVQVTGSAQGGILKVKDIVEIPEPVVQENAETK